MKYTWNNIVGDKTKYGMKKFLKCWPLSFYSKALKIFILEYTLGSENSNSENSDEKNEK